MKMEICQATTMMYGWRSEKGTGYKIEYQIMEWDGMWAMLNDERLDTVGEQISATDERREAYCLSEPYAYNIYSLLSRADNEELQSMDDLKDGIDHLL